MPLQNCDCENILVPKCGNPKKYADTDCGYLLGTHRSSTISTEKMGHVGGNSKKENQIIFLDDEKDSNIQVLGFQKISTLNQQSRIPPWSMVFSTNTCPVIKPESAISFNTKANRVRQKASSKGLHKTQSLPKSGYAPRIVSSIITFSSYLLPLRPLQVKTTIWTHHDGNHMVKDNHLQWWDFSLNNQCIDYNDWFREYVWGHTG